MNNLSITYSIENMEEFERLLAELNILLDKLSNFQPQIKLSES